MIRIAIQKLIFLGILLSQQPLDWGRLDSLRGIIYVDGKPFTGQAYKKLEEGELFGEYLDGIRHGLWQKFNRIQEPLMIGEYIKGKKNGIWQHWYLNGSRKLFALFDRFSAKASSFTSYPSCCA